MTAYQAGIAKFEEDGAQVFGISTDNAPTLRHWAEEHLKTTFPLLSDFQRKTSEAYGVLAPSGVASRTTFVVDRDGKIAYIEEGSAAVDPSGAGAACSRLKK
ncbi:MAG: redoxin domain-containing protein [Acidimicrobiia bacterium]|nr:redoxin domain-containing protein [Acidimicrobiia bacterium]